MQAGYHNTVDYEDTGCDVSQKCVRCPLEVCKHDDLKPYLLWKKEHSGKRNLQLEVKNDLERGDEIKDIAERHGIVGRSVYRIRDRIEAGQELPGEQGRKLGTKRR